MSSDECGAAAADGGERRDPSEKQEPHTVMWGKIHTIHIMENINACESRHFSQSPGSTTALTGKVSSPSLSKSTMGMRSEDKSGLSNT